MERLGGAEGKGAEALAAAEGAPCASVAACRRWLLPGAERPLVWLTRAPVEWEGEGYMERLWKGPHGRWTLWRLREEEEPRTRG